MQGFKAVSQHERLLYPGDCVRLVPRGHKRHFGRGRILAIHGSIALVQPFGRHRRIERMPLADLHFWKSANEESKRMAAERRHA